MKMRTIDNTGITVTVIKGETGANGYTPQKGIDYYTEADKQEFIGSIEEYVANGYAPIDSSGLVPSKHLYNAIPHATVSGYPISVSDHLEGESVIDYKIYGNSTQETRISKNLFSGFVKGVGLDWSTGAEITDSTYASSEYIAVDFNKNPNYTLYISADDFLYVYMYAYNSNKEYLGRHFIEYANDIFNSSSFNSNTTSNEGNIAYIRLCAYEDSSGEDHLGTIDVIDTWKVQLEIGEVSEEDIYYEPYGNMPSPEFPSEVQSVGDLVTDTSSENYGKYDVPVTLLHKNLFDKDKSSLDSIKNETAAEYWGVVIYRGNIIADTIKTNTAYTISFDVEVVSVPNSNDFTFKSGGFGFRILNKSNSLNMCYETLKLEQGKTYHRSSTFTIPDDLVYENMYFYANLYSKNSDNSSLHPQVIVRNIRIELGSAAPVTKHIYLDEPLRKVGDYADYIDYKNQSVVRQIEVLDSTGTKTIDESFGLLETPVTEDITVPDLTIPYSEETDFNIGTSTPPSSMDVTYYQDINKVITELKNAILAQGGNV